MRDRSCVLPGLPEAGGALRGESELLFIQKPLFKCRLLPGHGHENIEWHHFELRAEPVEYGFNPPDITPLPDMSRHRFRLASS